MFGCRPRNLISSGERRCSAMTIIMVWCWRVGIALIYLWHFHCVYCVKCGREAAEANPCDGCACAGENIFIFYSCSQHPPKPNATWGSQQFSVSATHYYAFAVGKSPLNMQESVTQQISRTFCQSFEICSLHFSHETLTTLKKIRCELHFYWVAIRTATNWIANVCGTMESWCDATRNNKTIVDACATLICNGINRVECVECMCVCVHTHFWHATLE